ncbi:MAG: sugar-binding protein, partial [Ruminococcus sp.]|nr:sugar-binding protein [Ruminococcus sp.]
MVSYTYTTDGKLSFVTDNSGVTAFTYDNMDGLTRVDYPDGSYVAYDYDNACRLTKVSTPFGDTSYDYDMLDRLTRVVDRNGYATIYEYDANGNRTAVRYANGYTTTYDYDLLNRLIRQETLDNDGEVVVQYIYTLGAAGERLSVAELDRTVEYTYDNLYRLTGETITEGEKVTAYTYAYDNVGNRILKTKNGAETVYTYNELNQLLSEDDITYEYDLNGNVVRMVSPTKSALYTYDSENHLVRATVQSGNNVSVEEYKYDYAGNRTSKKSEDEYTKYLLDINGELAYVLAEMDYDGTEKCFYTRGTDLISQERDGKLSYYLTDGHGSVRALVNEKGRVTDKYVYDAFGNLISSTGQTENDFLFAGEQFDPITGLYYLRARYM